jgi:hypothetical protein
MATRVLSLVAISSIAGVIRMLHFGESEYVKTM